MKLESLIPYIKAGISFLDRHSGAVLVIVTTVYAFFTVLLWRATNRQANISRQVFEASQRPWLTLKIKGVSHTQDRPQMIITVSLKNEGTIAATITRWSFLFKLRHSSGQEREVKYIRPDKPPPRRHDPFP